MDLTKADGSREQRINIWYAICWNTIALEGCTNVTAGAKVPPVALDHTSDESWTPNLPARPKKSSMRVIVQ